MVCPKSLLWLHAHNYLLPLLHPEDRGKLDTDSVALEVRRSPSKAPCGLCSPIVTNLRCSGIQDGIVLRWAVILFGGA
jgi:hypothetical protein